MKCGNLFPICVLATGFALGGAAARVDARERPHLTAAPCPVLLFGMNRSGQILEGREIIKSVSSSKSVACLLPDVEFKGHLFTAVSKPGLFKFSDYARVTVGCDHLFTSDREVLDLSPVIHSSLLQVDVPERYRIKTRLLDYLGNIARRDGGVWVLGSFGGHACHPRPWPTDSTDVYGRVSRSPVVAVRPHGSDDIGRYVVPDERQDLRAPAAVFPGSGGASGAIPLPPEEMDFPGRGGQ